MLLQRISLVFHKTGFRSVEISINHIQRLNYHVDKKTDEFYFHAFDFSK